MAGRPRKEKPFPAGLPRGTPVKVTGAEFSGTKLGLVYDMCKHDDGITVWLTLEESATTTISKYVCIQVERGDTIVSVAKPVTES